MPYKAKFSFEVNENGCWVCTDRFIDKDGYPRCKIDGSSVQAAKWLLLKEGVELDTKQVIRHTCDNPACINPHHWKIGTQYDNIQDRVKRNRSAKGSENGRSVLTEKQVADIKYKLVGKFTDPEIADLYNVDPSTIYSIRKGINWKHI